jgi:hypothetical protein
MDFLAAGDLSSKHWRHHFVVETPSKIALTNEKTVL